MHHHTPHINQSHASFFYTKKHKNSNMNGRIKKTHNTWSAGSGPLIQAVCMSPPPAEYYDVAAHSGDLCIFGPAQKIIRTPRARSPNITRH